MEQQTAGSARPSMLLLARESRGMTQQQLAAAMREIGARNMSKGHVSRAENGWLTIHGERLAMYARAVGYPAALLCRNEQQANFDMVTSCKRQALSVRDLKRIQALLTLTRIQFRALLSGHYPLLDIKPMPQIAVDEHTTPTGAARQIRAERMLTGPVDSMVTLLELFGVWVSYNRLAPVPLETPEQSAAVDAVSSLTPGQDPLVVLNLGTPVERQRFSMAHELGHMIMHQTPYRHDQEFQANDFAIELLMPARQIGHEFLRGPLNLSRLIQLKKRWKVSIWVLLRRARDLGAINERQYHTLAKEMARLGYYSTEPSEIDPEVPTEAATAINLRTEQGHDIGDLADATYLTITEFTDLYLHPAWQLPYG